MANTRSCNIAISNTVTSSSLTDFPYLLNRSAFPNEVFDPSGSFKIDTTGGALRFFDSTGTTGYPCDVVPGSITLDSTSGVGDGTIECHVKVPTLSSVSGATVQVQYGDNTLSQPAVTNALGRNAVWSAYSAVYHAGSLTDSTGNLNDMAEGNAPSKTGTTPWGTTPYSFTAASSQYLNVTAAVRTTMPLTLTSLFKPSTVSESGAFSILAVCWDVTPNYFVADMAGSGAISGSPIRALSYDGTTASSSNETGTTTAWHHVAAVFTSSTSRTGYLDGTAGTTDTTSVSPSSANLNHTIIATNFTGSGTLGNYFDGPIAENRVYPGALAAAWIAAESNNQLNPATYVTPGTPFNISGGATITVPLDNLSQTDNAPVVGTGAKVIVPQDSLTQTDNAPGVSTGIKATAPQDSLAQVDNTPTVVAGSNTIITVPLDTLVQTDNAPTVAIGVNVKPSTDTLGVTDNAPSIGTGVKVMSPVDNLVQTDNTPSVGRGVIIRVPLDTLSVASNAPSIAGGASVIVPADILSMLDNAPRVAGGVNVKVPLDSLSILFNVPRLTVNAGVIKIMKSLSARKGSITISGKKLSITLDGSVD